MYQINKLATYNKAELMEYCRELAEDLGKMSSDLSRNTKTLGEADMAVIGLKSSNKQLEMKLTLIKEAVVTGVSILYPEVGDLDPAYDPYMVGDQAPDLTLTREARLPIRIYGIVTGEGQ